MEALTGRGYLLCICTLAVLLFCVVACDEDPENRASWGGADGDADTDTDSDTDADTDNDADTDVDTDADTDADTDTDSDSNSCTTIEWGSGCSTNNIVSNWFMATALADSTGDHIVEPEEVTITLEQLHCSGHKSLLVMMGDSL